MSISFAVVIIGPTQAKSHLGWKKIATSCGIPVVSLNIYILSRDRVKVKCLVRVKAKIRVNIKVLDRVRVKARGLGVINMKIESNKKRMQKRK